MTQPTLTLDPSQERAVDLARRERLCVITGGPGTGKTTTMRTILDRMVSANEDTTIALASPTGKAAKRLSESTGRPATTVHRLLGFNPRLGGFAYDADCPLEADVVVIDESSMLDVELASALLEAIDPLRTRLILVGDANQLPSVGPGQVFADLVACGRVPVARLTHVHRSAQESWIAVNAPVVLSGEVPNLKPRHDFRLVEVEAAENIRAEVVKQVRSFGAGVYPQVLVPQNTLSAGADALNRALQAALNPPKPGEKVTPGEPRLGDRVIQTKNNYTIQVFNGEVGVVVEQEGKQCTVDFGDRPPVKYDFEAAEQLKLAYALTVHRYQGSENPWVICVVHSTHTHMLTRSLLYTAITRGKAGVVIVGDQKGVRAACKCTRDDSRNSGLVDRLSALIAASPAAVEAKTSMATDQAQRDAPQESAA